MLVMLAIAAAVVLPQETVACTGITLKAADGPYVVARTLDCGGSNLNSQCVLVPRGVGPRALTPSGTDRMALPARTGYGCSE